MLRDRIKCWTHAAAALAALLQLTGCSSWFGNEKPEPQTSIFKSGTSLKVSDEEKAKTNLELGMRYMEIGRLETALQKLQYALELDSGNNRIHNALGVLYERIGKDEEAREEFDKALSLKPDDSGVMSDYGNFLCNHGEYQQGMEYLKRAAASPLNERKWYANAYAGQCEYAQGNYPQAEDYMRTALQEQPNFSTALVGMIKISYQNAQYLSTRAFLERYAAVNAHNSETLWYAVQTERQLGNDKQAEEYRQKLLQQFPQSPQAKQLKNIF